MLKHLLLYTTLLCVSIFNVKAQQISMDTIKVKEISQQHGLSQLNAISLAFDNLGYLWVATENGLNRFNGYQMKVYKSGDLPHNLPDDHIRDIHQSNDTLWLATNTYSICAYLPKEDRFISFEDQLDFEKYPSLKFAYDLTPVNERYLLASTINYCVLIDRKTLDFKVFSINSDVDNEYITSMVPFKEESYLMATNYKNAFIFDFKTLRLTPFKKENGKLINAMLDLDPYRTLISTEKGLFIYDSKIDKFKEIDTPIPNNQISRLFRWDNNNILVTAANRNFLINEVYQCKEITFEGNQGKTMYTTIRSIQTDVQGGKWLGTEGRGVLYHHPHQKKFQPYRISTSNSPKKDFISIFNFLKEGDTLWMATEFGLVRYLNSTKKYKLYLTNNLDYTLAKDQSGTLWAGGFGDGLLEYNRKTDKFENVPLPISDNEVIHITPVSMDSIWVHTWSDGIYAFNVVDRKIKKKTFNGESLIRSRNSLIDSSGDIWLASDNGLYQVRKGQTIYYDSLSNERVFSIAEDLNHNLWVGTAKGLNKINKKTGEVKYFTQQEGLPNDFIYGTEVDHRGNIWVSTNYGLSQFNQTKGTFTNYTEQDGLQNNEFNGKASYKDRSGRLYFGGMNGFNIIDVDSIPINDVAGNTIIENIQLFGKPIKSNVPYKNKLNLTHEQNVITFNFVNLNYLWPDKNHFRFKLDGFDKDWRPVTQDRSSTYTNLNPGNYTFKVQGSNNEMVWGNTDSFEVVINAPWYQRLWFKILVVFLVFLGATSFVLYRHGQQRRINKKLSKMVEERTNSLVESNEALKASLETTNKQKENISYLMRELNHRVKNNLQLMTSLIDFQNVNSKDSVQSKQLKQLQSRIFTLAKIHDSLNQQDLRTKKIQLDKFIDQLALDIILFSGSQIKLETDLLPLVLPNDHLSYIGLILNELITNSIKHAFDKHHPNPHIYINLRKEKQIVVFEYRDNGKGFTIDDIQAKDNMGINLIQLLTAELKMDLEIRAHQGSCFIFSQKIEHSLTTKKDFNHENSTLNEKENSSTRG